MTIRSGEEAYDSLIPIMRRYGAEGSPREFFEAVNRIFHDAEARVYDDIHGDMWESLPAIFDLLVEDASRAGAGFPARVALLDVGCGTGLATEIFRRTSAGPRLAEACLLDTSAAMLERARERARGWAGVEARTRLGTVFEIPEGEAYDVVLASSVLHHIPDLPGFFRRLEPLLRPGGLFFHFQDQNAEAEEGDVLKRRQERARALALGRSRDEHGRNADLRSVAKDALRSVGLLGLARRMRHSLVPRSLAAVGRRDARDGDYLSQVNRALLAKGVVRRRPMTGEDIWRVTDIHVGRGFGLSTREMRRFLPDCECLSTRTYGFFGTGPPPPPLLAEERELIAARDMHGSLLAAVWQRRRR